MDSIILEDVRCFRGRIDLPLTPLTFLVGENSSGKSTALAMIRAAWDVAHGIGTPNFNEDPFLLGSYENIAHFHGGQGKRARSFVVGYKGKGTSTHHGHSDKSVSFEGVFRTDSGQPRLSSWRIHDDLTSIEMSLGLSPTESRISLKSGSSHFEMDTEGLTEGRYFSAVGGLPLLMEIVHLILPAVARRSETHHRSRDPEKSLIEKALALAHLAEFSAFTRPYAVAPIRTKPSRTYDPVQNAPTPEGGHVPGSLARMFWESAEETKKLRTTLHRFGRSAGLFDRLNVRRLGHRKQSDPFQIDLSLSGQVGEMNLVDVGYGVSQVLPVLVDTLEAKSNVLLLQQPEVHLHPRAQAELGSFLCAISKPNKRIVVETHSDYLIDRVGVEVRAGLIAPTEVSIVYFERATKGGVCPATISFDGQGNLLGVPSGYRRFFLSEQEKVLGG